MEINNINEIGGLHLDTSPQNQPKGTSRFILNGINETNEGDQGFISNEGSNVECSSFTPGFIPIGKEYIGNGQTIIFLVNSDETVSEIGIYDDMCRYEVHVNDALSSEKDKLNFKVSKQVDATYRLRRGCERTVYFVDGDNNRPRYYNFDKPQDFKNNNGTWNASKFNLQKSIDKIPEFNEITVLNSGGQIEPGSINIGIRYLDEGLNPSEFINVSDVIKIYNDSTNNSFLKINGSINSDTDYLNFPITSKAIQVKLNQLDQNYIFYQLAFIHADNGSGLINKILYTEPIPTSNNTFVYNGNNATIIGTREEIQQFTDFIERAEHIEQSENILYLSNTKGSDVNLCKLQKYASRIKADCITKKVILNTLENNNIINKTSPKFPTLELENNTGYMPGEKYSFGIFYIFEDNTFSSVYHIPGKNHNTENQTFTQGDNIFPMSIYNNTSQSLYTNNNSCDNTNIWGLDSEGSILLNTPIRHHRFPLRTEINKPLVVEESNNNIELCYHQLKINIEGTLIVPTFCPSDNLELPSCQPRPILNFLINYTVNEQPNSFIININPNVFQNDTGVYNVIETGMSPYYLCEDNIEFNDIQVLDINTNEYVDFNDFVFTPDYYEETPIVTNSIEEIDVTQENQIFSTEILGIKFSGIDIPSEEEIGKKVIGYYIVRNERTDVEKTIIDSAILTPMIQNQKYISHGLLNPEESTFTSSSGSNLFGNFISGITNTVINMSNAIHKNIFSFINLDYKFFNKELNKNSFDEIIHQGTFTYDPLKIKYSKTTFQDIYDGSSFNSEEHKDRNDDGQPANGNPNDYYAYDGWSLDTIFRDTPLEFEQENTFIIQNNKIDEMFHLSALDKREINEGENLIYNIAGDNKIGVIKFNEDSLTNNKKFPYIVLRKNNIDSYSTFRNTPYYKEHDNPKYFDTDLQPEIWNGDSYVSPIRYNNTVFWDNRIARRSMRTNAWNWIGGIVLIIVGTILTFFTGGASTLVIGAGLSLIGAGALFVSSGIKENNYKEAYGKEYERGLRQTTLDKWVHSFYSYQSSVTDYIGLQAGGNGAAHGKNGPSDDSIQWISDCLTNLWFETSFNVQLRNQFFTELPTHLESPSPIETGNNTPISSREHFNIHWIRSLPRYPVSSLERHVNNKLLVSDVTRNDLKLYIGHPLGEYYNVNPDYLRTNKEKIYYHLPLEYDCCSDCNEEFPHRTHYSLQSFQEELTDNFRIFLSNNYRDLEGNTGVITDLFKINNELFIHTEEGLWQVPRNYQERVTDQIVSFIGTGDLFAVPPRLIIDSDTGSSAGTKHKWGTIKTPHGIYFISENERKIYKFNGQQLQPISSMGLESWFYNNLKLKNNEQYYLANFKEYPYNNNPSNIIGTGFISTYDNENERIIFTKKDIILNLPANTGLCQIGNTTTIFPDLNETISEEENEGWIYLGIENCKLKFSKDILSIGKIVTEYKYIEGVPYEGELLNNSWTISYSLKTNTWTSWHSYLPNIYINTPNKFFSWIHGDNNIWKHNVKDNYQHFYNNLKPFIIEYVSLSNPIVTRLWEHLLLLVEVKKYNNDFEQYVDINDRFFNKLITYNSRQCSGLMNIKVKNTNEEADYLYNQINNLNNNEIIVDRNERNWTINNLRDIRTNYNEPIFISKLNDLQQNYFIDKILNTNSIDYNKDWTQLESFRDKYLVVRLIFDNFAQNSLHEAGSTKIIMNISSENETQSFR